jgi:integrase
MVAGKRREIGLGSLATKSLAQAREEAAKLRSNAKKGDDILEQKRLEKRRVSIPTFEEAATSFHAEQEKTFTNEDHAYNWIQTLKTYVFPVFGKKTVEKVDSADVLLAIGPMWNEIPDTAKRTLRRVKNILDYCSVSGHRTINANGTKITLPNPCDGIRTALPKQSTIEKHHEALPYAELPDFITKLRTTNTALSVKLAFEFLILTAARTSEVLDAKWEEIDLEKKTWVVPAARMKMSIEHRVPLAARAIEILTLAKQFNDDAVVFPGRYPGHSLSKTALLMVLRRMGKGDLTVHGFRATFKTWAEETTQTDSLVIEACMAHTVKGIERHYLRTTFFKERQKLMEAWADFATGSPQ